MTLGPAIGTTLLALARQAIATWLGSGRRLDAPSQPPEMCERRGVFVTLREGEQLRGCIGYPLPSKVLGAAVVDSAIAAATRDPRFPAVTDDELPRLTIEVSVLTPPSPVSPEAVVVGRDGLTIELGGRRGLLLPQVAVEQGWDRDALLGGVCLKAGLAVDAWQDAAARLERFEAEVFTEPEPPEVG